jgi:DNA adenine methylase
MNTFPDTAPPASEHGVMEVQAPKKTDAASPFRYPGGKAFLERFLEQEVKSLTGPVRHYVEPFAGGAGAALNMLKSGAVQMVHLNDLDVRVYSAWRAVLEETERFADRIMSVNVDIETWQWAREQMDKTSSYSFDLGFATFFVNRTSRAGILMGSGPIGGYKQDGIWKIGARFYRETLVRRVKWIGTQAPNIRLSNATALTFLSEMAEALPKVSTYYFIDPPYVRAGARLYLNAMGQLDHQALANFIDSHVLENWSITYDYHPDVRQLYKCHQVRSLSVAYSLGRRRKETEVLITPLHRSLELGEDNRTRPAYGAETKLGDGGLQVL